MQSFIKSLILGVVLAVVGYAVAPMLGALAGNLLLPLGLFLGTLIGGLVMCGGFTGAGASSTSGSAASGDMQSIFVGNLAFKARNEELRELFGKYGEVGSVRIMTDRQTRRPRGFAFVEMPPAAAAKAIKALDGQEFIGRPLRVSEGTERKPRS